MVPVADNSSMPGESFPVVAMTATIPDIFESFMSRPPRIHDGYEEVGRESMAWISRVCMYDAKQQIRLRKAEFAYFAGVAFPDAPLHKLRTIADWFNWVFAFDDKLDDGVFEGKKDEAFAYIDGMAEVLQNSKYEVVDKARQPWQSCLLSIWERIQGDLECPASVKQRWKTHMLEYFAALKETVEFMPSSTLESTISRYMRHRRHSICVDAIFAFVEYAGNIELPAEIVAHDSLRTLNAIGVELQMLANDCVSYHRERDLGCTQNVIHFFRYHGLTEQEGYDRVQVMLRELYHKWHATMTGMPFWGEDIDRQVYQYVDGIQDVARANANWSFRTERYFGKDRQQIRKTRTVVTELNKTDWLVSIIPNMTEVEVLSSMVV